jgi:hypothetical protein
MLSPWISFTTETSPKSGHDLLDYLTALLPTLGALAIFYFTTRTNAKLARKQRKGEYDRLLRTLESERQRDRDAQKHDRDRDRIAWEMNTKREVMLEAAPALQRHYRALALYGDEAQTIRSIRDGLEAGADGIVKLQVIGNDVTLKAAQEYMMSIGVLQVRLMKARVEAERSGRPVAEVTLVWMKEVGSLIPLMAALLEATRAELGLKFDRKGFENGMRVTNRTILREVFGSESDKFHL